MSGFFYNLGRRLAPQIMKAKWVGASLTGSESDKLKVEQRMGARLAGIFARTARLLPDDPRSLKVRDIRTRLARRLRNRERTFHITCMEYPDVNALAFPGGYLFVSASLVDLCGGDRDELAFTVAHEMGHVVLGHAAKRYLTDAMLRTLAARSRAVSPGGQAVKGLVTRLVQQSYSQNHETEADRFAIHLAASAGFRPMAAVTFLKRLAALSPEPSALGQYFSSHPALAERIEHIQAESGKVAKALQERGRKRKSEGHPPRPPAPEA